ncbi:hypothetical protein F4W09_14790 [Acinetobacter tandoii]|uniref:Uncharacterized protein n=1 Tax=Acinetobacter tandoii TaxID=202954 RepID=A0A5N4W5I2_9GAMM|nr:hypothetical protein [Acinetobacter tandoii]KAB1852264.1 hypothetical protein F4W09_14790 [Acinetobacter tandoii]
MTIVEFRADLYKTYIASGMQDHVLIQEYINIAEAFVFHEKKFTKSEWEQLTRKLAENPN